MYTEHKIAVDDLFEARPPGLRTYVSGPIISPPIRTTNRPQEDNFIRRRAQLHGVDLDDVEMNVNIRGNTQGWRINDPNVSAVEHGNGIARPQLPRIVHLRNENLNRTYAYRIVGDNVGNNIVDYNIVDNDEVIPSAIDMYNPSQDTFFDTVSYVQTPVEPMVVEDDADVMMWVPRRAPEDASMSEERAIVEYELMHVEAGQNSDGHDEEDE